MPLEDDDLFLVQRGSEVKSATASSLKEYTVSGFTGTVTLSSGETMTIVDGLIIDVNP